MTLALLVSTLILSGQNRIVEGYVYEEDNRGYLGMALIKVSDFDSKQVLDSTFTDTDGHFTLQVPAQIKLNVSITKDMFENFMDTLHPSNEKHFINAKMKRLPGYVFEITLAEKRDEDSHIANAIKGAHIEVYNNTTKTVVMDIPSHPLPEFRLNMLKGNHYTILIRKDGYLAKRMEAFVNINGCILCFEGVGDVKPGVTDNLSGSNSIGMLLANVELDKIEIGKLFGISNIYYASGSAELNEASMKELDKVALMAKDNPNIIFELGSHTDHVGNSTSNLALSEKRANEVVNYLVNKKDVRKNQLLAKGYGESFSINNCTDENPCTDAKLAKNRRTELKILGLSSEYRQMSLQELKNIEEFEKNLRLSLEGSGAQKIDKNSEGIIKKDIEVIATPENPDVESEINVVELKLKNEKTPSQKEIFDKKYRIQAGTFKDEKEVLHLLDKLLLLGYSDAYFYEDKNEYILLADQTSDANYALKVIDDLIKNGINARVVEK